MRRLTLGAAALVAGLTLSSCGLLGGKKEPSPDSGAMVHLVTEPLPSETMCFSCGDLVLAARPSAEDLAVLERRGVVAVVDLCPEAAGDDVGVTARELGLRYTAIQIDEEPLSDDQVDSIMEQLAVGREGRLLIVCETGSRSAMIFAIHRGVQGQGLSIDEVIDEAHSAGMKPGATGDFVRRQIVRLTAEPGV